MPSFPIMVALLILALTFAAFFAIRRRAESAERKRAADGLGFMPSQIPAREFGERMRPIYRRTSAAYRFSSVLVRPAGNSDVYSYNVRDADNGSGSAPVLAVSCSDLALPAFAIVVPSTLMARLGAPGRALLAASLKDGGNPIINVSDNPEFAKHFVVGGEDDLAVRAALRPAMGWLAEIANEDGMQFVQISGNGSLLAWAWSSRGGFRSADQAGALNQ